MKKSLLITGIIIFSINISCKKEQPSSNNRMFSEDGTRVSDSMMAVVKGHLNTTKKVADSIVKNRPQKTKSFSNNTTVIDNGSNYQNKKFVFVVLNVSEPTEIGADYKKYSQKQIVSGINEIYDYNEDKKAMLEDEIIQNYSMRAFSGNVVSKETYSFGSYASASKKRNTYLIENP
ncbi:hypothetical protein [Chryseobacterium taiwanense]|uniref:Uncharacterized protein n=1 Tax=Chryseobacterium taiwanense TaxID=363331 RepID=A0A0B4DBN3_9FLAO|nr:hypothetical protein [Chryseobacterium taiwanense]KIC61725.1 hypothetical protein RM51_15110 [Chryseobacterium taiwanense]